MCIRDRFLNWRYADCPDHSYRLYECRERQSRTLRGIAVYTVRDFMRPNTGFIADWLNEGNDVDAMIAMLSTLEEQAKQDQVGILASVWNHVDIRFVHIQHAGYLVKGTPYFITATMLQHTEHFYRANWYLTIGDSDLI